MSKVAELIARSRAAQKQFEHATQEQADAAARAVLKVIYDNAESSVLWQQKKQESVIQSTRSLSAETSLLSSGTASRTDHL